MAPCTHVSRYLFFVFIFFNLVVIEDAAAASPHFEDGLDLSLDAGYRTDDITFDIGFPGGPNILSELTWSSLKIYQARLGAEYRSNRSILWASASRGTIDTGSNQDSDYLGNDRTFEFSRSNNSANGDNVLDYEIAIGHRFEFESRSRSRFSGNTSSNMTVLLGYSYHQQNLVMTDGVQTVDPLNIFGLGPFPAYLSSTYKTEWKGPWLGFRITSQSRVSKSIVNIVLKHHWPDYYAEADWNLRTDFAHPKSFEHQAEGHGNELFIEWLENAQQSWSWSVALHVQDWAASGDDTTYFFDGTSSTIPLNGANWESTALLIGIKHRL